MKSNFKNLGWILLLYVFVLGGCKDKEGDPAPESSNLVSASLVANVPKTLMQTYAVGYGFEDYVDHIKYDVSFYKLIYKTTFKGNEIEASGLLAIPRNTPTTPALLSAQHGTMFRNADAPSFFLTSPTAFSGFELFGATGYITAIPDYIGMGVSSSIVQPVYDETYAALAVVDMLKATKSFLKNENIAVNNNLFLLGYSEGGYVTMAAQKEIETDASHKLDITAVAAGAGAYDLPVMMSMVATATTYTTPAFLAKIVYAYNNTYDWNRPMSDFFQDPYAAAIPGLLDGSKSGDEIDAQLTDIPADLFAPAFYQNLQNPSGETVLKQKLAENSFLNWVPESPTRLYHGTEDETVYFQTTQSTYDRFIQGGATNVTLVPIPGGGHISSIEPMVFDALQWFESLNN